VGMICVPDTYRTGNNNIISYIDLFIATYNAPFTAVTSVTKADIPGTLKSREATDFIITAQLDFKN
jgi:hypothetical protein